MKWIQNIGVLLLVCGVVAFSASLFIGSYELKDEQLRTALSENVYNNFAPGLLEQMEGKEFESSFAFSEEVRKIYSAKNEEFRSAEQWDKVSYDSPHDFAGKLASVSVKGEVAENPSLWLFLTFGLSILGGLLFVLPQVITLGAPGIKNDHVYHHKLTNKGWIAWVIFLWLVGFYIILYFYPDYTVNWARIVDPVSMWLKGSPGDRWFLYGLMYCSVMTVMAIRMFIKYRNNRYQVVRTASVLFFQIAFAFLIPEIMARFNMPGMDFKNIWPLDYDFFFGWNLDQMMANGTLGLFMLVWGMILVIVAVPVFVYFFGKRWYCSWVCGCGGLAETMGDPYRQHSDKSLRAWKIERWLIHAVLVFAVVMTGLTLYTYFSGASQIWIVDTYDVQKTYGFLIGSVFSGVIGTGFYPVMGNRVWCRFGCPLAAYLGLVQRFKSRFRITTNGGQCISCGNCSTYCEQGIDVRWYAQRGQNIVRSSCVGCGVCSAVCPRGVLKLENGPEKGRINENPILIGKDGAKLIAATSEI